MIAYKIYENNIIFSLSENVMHHFRKSKIVFISLKSVQTVYAFIIKYFIACHMPSISNLFPNIEQRLLFKMVWVC